MTLFTIWCGAAGRRPDAAAHRPQPGRAVRPAAEPRRRHQAGAQGRHHPEGRRQGRSSSSRRSSRRSPAFLAFAVIPFGPRSSIFGAPHRAAAHRPAGRGALHPRDRLGRHLRHRARRLVERLDVPAARRPALVGPDDLLRGRDGPVVRRRLPLRRLDVDVARSSPRRPTAGTPSCSLPSFVIYVDLDGRRDQPRAVRPARGRGRAGRRVPHRVLLAEVRAVLPRRVRQHGHRLGAGDDAVPRRLAGALAARRCWDGRERGLVADAVVRRQAARSSCSSSSGCAARCRGCATTSSCGSAGRCSSRSRWAGCSGRHRARAQRRVRRSTPARSLLYGGVGRGRAHRPDLRLGPASRRARSRTRSPTVEAECDPMAGGHPVPPLPGSAAAGAHAVGAATRRRHEARRTGTTDGGRP